jgi:putative membrane protein
VKGPADLHRRRDTRRAAAMAAGLAAVALALAPPLEQLAAERFAAHMGQHLLLMLVAAPLIAAARPVAVAAAALPAPARDALHHGLPGRLRPVARRLRHPLAVWLLGTAVVWGWHAPALYQLALRTDAVHALEHGMFLGAAGLFWSLVFRAGRGGAVGGDAARPAALALVFATGLSSGALGAVLTFAGAPLYPDQATIVAAAGGDPLADQQLAGVLMWMPPGVLYLAVMTWLLVAWFRELDSRTAGDRPGPVAAGNAVR